MGEINSAQVFQSILQSKALKSGLVENLEDTAIFIHGIGRDKVSDMTTNIIRANLIKYTQDQCRLWGIPLESGVPSGFFWNPTARRWQQEHTDMLVIKGKRILLVPKSAISYVKEFNASKYHQHHALEYLQEEHLRKGTALVQATYDDKGRVKRRFVTKKSLIEEDVLPQDKDALVDFTRRHPAVFKGFKTDAAGKVKPMQDADLESINTDELVDYLITQLKSIPKGNGGAAAYHNLMIGVLEFIFYPNLVNPVKEAEQNQGRKRIDIAFENGGPQRGFFFKLQHTHGIPCPYVFIECKNYSKDIRNPELDQMVGRLSPNRGKFGIIVCRDIDDEDLFLQRCADSYKSDHGLIVPLTDVDIIQILESKKQGVSHYEDELLSAKARKVIMG